MASRIVVAYPFHPLHGQLLEVVSTPRHREGAVTVRDPEGKRLKVPSWMLDEDASRVQLANQVVISVAALQALDELIRLHQEDDCSTASLLPRRLCDEQEPPANGEDDEANDLHKASLTRARVEATEDTRAPRRAQAARGARRADGRRHRGGVRGSGGKKQDRSSR